MKSYFKCNYCGHAQAWLMRDYFKHSENCKKLKKIGK